jgi:hypothetical protein
MPKPGSRDLFFQVSLDWEANKFCDLALHISLAGPRRIIIKNYNLVFIRFLLKFERKFLKMKKLLKNEKKKLKI